MPAGTDLRSQADLSPQLLRPYTPGCLTWCFPGAKGDGGETPHAGKLPVVLGALHQEILDGSSPFTTANATDLFTAVEASIRITLYPECCVGGSCPPLGMPSIPTSTYE